MNRSFYFLCIISSSIIAGCFYRPAVEECTLWSYGGTRLFRLDSLTKYPPEARAAGIQGGVSFQLLIDRNGYPRAVRNFSSDNHMFDSAAIQAVMSERYTRPYDARNSRYLDSAWQWESVGFKLPTQEFAPLGKSLQEVKSISLKVSDTLVPTVSSNIFELHRQRQGPEILDRLPAGTLCKTIYYFSNDTLSKAVFRELGRASGWMEFTVRTDLQIAYESNSTSPVQSFSADRGNIHISATSEKDPAIFTLTLERK